MTATEPTVDELVEGVARGDRRALARAITLVESSRAGAGEEAERLLRCVPRRTGVRVGITGLAGAGKSTLIEALGLGLIARGKRVAVLAIDPRSPKTGGSVLGDKLRMPGLSNHPDAFVRPSPATSETGGLGSATLDALLLCEAAGYDFTFVETVGAGQSDWDVAYVVDFLLLVLLPGAGDDVQAMKRGVLELVDLILVTRADGPSLPEAKRTRDAYAGGVSLLRDPPPEVLAVSAPGNVGVQEILEILLRQTDVPSEQVATRRGEQQVQWFRRLLRRLMEEKYLGSEESHRHLEGVEARLRAGVDSARQAAREWADSLP